MRDFKINDRVREINLKFYLKPDRFLILLILEWTKGDLQVGIVLKGTGKPK